MGSCGHSADLLERRKHQPLTDPTAPVAVRMILFRPGRYFKGARTPGSMLRRPSFLMSCVTLVVNAACRESSGITRITIVYQLRSFEFSGRPIHATEIISPTPGKPLSLMYFDSISDIPR